MIILLIIFVFLKQDKALIICEEKQNILRKYIRGRYKNILSLQNGAIISQSNSNINVYFAGGNINGLLLRDSIYYYGPSEGFTYCLAFDNIIIQTLQTYELNTLVQVNYMFFSLLWFWDLSQYRYYQITIYAIHKKKQVLVYQGSVQNVVQIRFPDQIVDVFQIYANGCNTDNCFMHIIKAEAYCKFK